MSNMKQKGDGTEYLGTGAAKKAAKAIKRNKKSKQKRLGDIMQGLRYSRKR